MTQIYLSIIFLFLAFIPLKAQKWASTPPDTLSAKESYFITGWGAHYQFNFDERMTPLIHRGPGIGLYGRSQEYKEGVENQFLFYAQAALTNRTNFGETGTYLSARGHFAFRSLYDLRNHHWRLGYAISQEFNLRNYPTLGNSRNNLDAFSSAELNAAWFHAFQLWDRNFILDIQARLPLISYAFRIPEYAVTGRAQQFAFPWDFQRLQTSVELIIPFKNVPQNCWSIQYVWDYYAFRQKESIHQLMVAQHALVFNYWMKTR